MARIECRNCSKYSGWPACGGYRAGERREGMISLWTVLGDEFAIEAEIRCVMFAYGEPSCVGAERGM